MKRLFFKFINFFQHQLHYLVLAFFIGLLSIIFPVSAKFRYQFELGQTWLYNDLVSNVDFPIKKNAEELKIEIRQIENVISPFYHIDLDEIKARKKLFQTNFEELLKRSKSDFPDVSKNNEIYENFGTKFLDRLLFRGILSSDSIARQSGKNIVVNIIRGNEVNKEAVEMISTPEKILDEIKDSLTQSRLKEPAFLYITLKEFLSPNLIYDAKKTQDFKQQEIDKIVSSRGLVKRGDLIIHRGGNVTPEVYQKLISYKEQFETEYITSRQHVTIILGYLLLVSLVFVLYFFYFKYFYATYFAQTRWLVFLFGLIVLHAYLMLAIKSTGILDYHLLPFCIAPIIVKNFLTREMAYITHLVTVLIVGLILAPGYEFIFLQLLAGLVIAFSRFETRYWNNFFQSIFILTGVYLVGYLGLSLIEEPNIRLINWKIFIWLILNGFLTLIAYPLIPLLGQIFGFTSSITLSELSDINHPLLRDLYLKAPGTFQHSLQVAHLSEAAAKAIGADDVLLKVAALYHDIGKMDEPMYFIENQTGKNLHDDLNPFDSARIIINHVERGVRYIDKYNLPDELKSFINSHHGTTYVEYFLNKAEKEQNLTDDERNLFKYKGPTPRSKEETILMIADSVEAWSRALVAKEANVSFENLVRRVIEEKARQKQFINSRITFEELEICIKIFSATLKNIYHNRISYPDKIDGDEPLPKVR